MARAVSTPLSQPVFHEPAFNEQGGVSAVPAGFLTPHPSDDSVYQQIEDALKRDVVAFTPSRLPDEGIFTLAAALGEHGPEVVSQITNARRIVFHALGDSGASNAHKYANELRVADQLTMDSHADDATNRPAFLYHLGDVVYDFGEAKYYYDQFYEPFRNYPAPIFAIPGNHDSFIVPGTPPAEEPLAVFSRNFCAEKPAITAEAGSLHRTAMTQPGVYFTLDAPFVRIIGLFSNSLEDPGVISSEGGKWPAVPDTQLAYLKAQLQRIKDEDYKGAVLLAVHHPPFTYAPPADGRSGNHGGSPAMLRQIDEICLQIGVYPHAVISGHAHNMQRYTRTVKFAGKEYDVPFIVCGDGGHNVNKLVQARRGQNSQEPENGSKVDYLDANSAIGGGLVLEKYDDTNYGYLRISVDAEQLRIGFHEVTSRSLLQSRFDLVTVDLASHTMVAN
jgi:hypothetical protein